MSQSMLLVPARRASWLFERDLERVVNSLGFALEDHGRVLLLLQSAKNVFVGVGQTLDDAASFHRTGFGDDASSDEDTRHVSGDRRRRK